MRSLDEAVAGHTAHRHHRSQAEMTASLRSPVHRGATALLLLVIAAVHLNLYAREYYNRIPTVGWLFLLTVISAVALAAGVVVRPGWLTNVSAGLFALGVLGGYLLTLYLPQGLFGFKEPGISYSGAISIGAEIAVAAISLRFVAHQRQQRQRNVPLLDGNG